MSFPLRRLVCLVTLLILFLFPAHAAPNGLAETEFYDHSLHLYQPDPGAIVRLELDGNPLPADDVPAVIWQGRTMVPVRLIGEKIGASVSWVDETNQVILRRGDRLIVLTLGSATALVNGKPVTLYDAIPATLARLDSVERTMVPLRFVSEQLGCAVSWAQESYTASIRTPKDAPGVITAIQADANAQTVLISSDIMPTYRVMDLGDRVVVDLLGFRLASGFPGAIHVDNELITSVRYAQHGSDLYGEYDHTVRVVLDLKDGISLEENVVMEAVGQGLAITTFLPHRDEIDYTPSVPLDPQKKTVVLDPGHGGSADGAKYEGVAEKNINLAVARKLEALLRNKGYNVVMTRTDDSAVGLYDRADIANALNADIFVSLHSNASETNLEIQGIYTYCYPGSKQGAALAQSVQSAVSQITGAPDRGTPTANFVVLRETHMSAVLVEMGFMSTHDELMKLISDTYQDKLAHGIAEGIVQYLNENG